MPNRIEPARIYTTEEVAEIFSTSIQGVYRMREVGLRSFKLSRGKNAQTRFLGEHLLDFARARAPFIEITQDDDLE